MKARLPRNMSGGAQNMNSMVKKAQKMQEQIIELQDEIEKREFTAQLGGGAVSVKMNGGKELLSVEIKPEVVDPEDIEMLQDLIISAVNECIKSINETSENEMGAITGGVSFPGLF